MNKTINLNNLLYKNNYIADWLHEANADVIENYKKSKSSDEPKLIKKYKREQYNGVVKELNKFLRRYKEDKKEKEQEIKIEVEKKRGELLDVIQNYIVPNKTLKEINKDIEKSKHTQTKEILKFLDDDIKFIIENLEQKDLLKGYKTHIARLINGYSLFYTREVKTDNGPAIQYIKEEVKDYFKEIAKNNDIYIELNIIITLYVTFSTDEKLEKKIKVSKHREDIPYRNIHSDPYDYIKNIDLISAICYLSIASYWNCQDVSEWEIFDIKIFGIKEKIDAEQYGMTLFKPTKLTDKIKGIEMNDNTENINCVKKYMLKIYDGRYKEQIEKLPIGKYGITIQTIYNFCVNNNLIMTAYNRKLKIISEYNPPKPKHQKRLMFVAYNNHCYPIDQKQQLKKKLEKPGEHTFNEIIEISDVHKIFIDMLNDGELIDEKTIIYEIPKKSKEIKIIQFAHKKILYTQTNKTRECINVLKHLGIKHDVTPKINDNILFDVIMKQYEGINAARSFFPFVDVFRKYPCMYQTEELINKEREIMTLDFSKYYGNILRELKYLPVINLMTANVEDCDISGENAIFDFKKYYLAYSLCNDKNNDMSFINPLVPPGVGFYSGVFLTECKKRGVYVHAYKSIDCTYTQNIFSGLIKSLYDAVDSGKLNNDVVKIAINRYIGRMYKGLEKTTHEVIESLGTIQQCQTEEGKFMHKINNDFAITINHVEDVKMYNMMPIYCEIIDNSRLKMFDLINNLGLSPKDIIKINTDSLTFYKTYNLFKLDNFIKPNKCYGMKDETNKYKPFQTPINMIGAYTKCADIREHYEQIDIKKDYFKICYSYGWGEQRQLYNCVAGCGKTYSIIKKLIPNFGNDYIVLTPTHDTRREYNKNKLNNAVIQKYTMSGKIPEEQNIIIDEVGLMNKEMNMLIFKLAVLGRNIFSFGDFRQLFPVGCDNSINQPYYINMLYKNVFDIKINNRNNFSFEYYDMLQNCNYDLNILKRELRKHSTSKYYDSDIIICNTNKACEIYNKLVLQKLNKSPYDIGVMYQCKTNDLCEKDIYNKHVLKVSKNNEKSEMITLSDDDGNEITLKYSQLDKYFSLGYARTAYGVQGISINKIYYFNKDDIINNTTPEIYELVCKQEDNYLNGRFAYTVISRIKNKINKYTEMPIYYSKPKNNKKFEYIGIN